MSALHFKQGYSLTSVKKLSIDLADSVGRIPLRSTDFLMGIFRYAPSRTGKYIPCCRHFYSVISSCYQAQVSTNRLVSVTRCRSIAIAHSALSATKAARCHSGAEVYLRISEVSDGC